MASEEFREQYPVFLYRDYTLRKSETTITLAFNFTIEGLCDFSPEIRIETGGRPLVGVFDSDSAKRIVFALGLVEAVSYMKPVCPKTVRVLCGALSGEEKLWFKKLWYNGLGEFFFINSLHLSFDEFVDIEAPEDDVKPKDTFVSAGFHLIPIGGGKDSCVTASLLREQNNLFFTVNDQQARTDCIKAAGYGDGSVIRTYRTIDSRLLDLNKRGFLNGHTPFSAIVAFLSLYCAYIFGCEDIVLSNEASANEGNIGKVNHQYSKSFEFERDFNMYTHNYITQDIRYFSLLRPFNELQIAKYFADEKQFHSVFRSCNKGSKQNIWCCACPKCLFVYGILSPFLTDGELSAVFPENLFDKELLLKDFKGLLGRLPVKPFECVGTASEYLAAVAMKTEQLKAEGKPLPPLLRYLSETTDTRACAAAGKPLLSAFNEEHLVPEKLINAVKEMQSVVAADN